MISTSATRRSLAAGGEIGCEQWLGLNVLLNPHFMGKEMAKKIIHGERLYLGGYRGDERVVFGTQTGE
jgi:hypothetical protein